MSMNYLQYITRITSLAEAIKSDMDFAVLIPATIDYAEQRIYRELDMITANINDGSASTTANSRNFTLPTSIGTFQIVDQINIITPASTAPDSGTRNPCTPVSLSVLNWSWPSVTNAGVPRQFAYATQSSVAGQNNIIFGPWPDATYRVEVIGKVIPTPLSASNATTFLTLYLPDLFMAASMVFLTSKTAAQLTPGWENSYQQLLASALSWEARKRFSGASWTSKQLEPTAQPQRG